jgi:curved DNA-binding protein CbpA
MEEENIANKGEAEKCRDIAKAALSKGEYDRAIKFFDKSLRLHRLPGVEALRAKAEQLKNSGGSAPSSSSKPTTNSNTNNNSSDSTPKASGNVGAAGRSYTNEEEAMAKKVLAASKRSHYEVLGVAKDANADQIKKAYRKLALKLHPDKNSAPSAEQAFKVLSTAFDTLSDPAKRDLYDQVGHENSVNNPNGAGAGGFPGGFPGGFGGAGVHEVSPEDILNMFFTGAAGPQFRGRFGGVRGRTFHFGGGFPQHRQGRQHDEDDDRRSNRQQQAQQPSFLQQIMQLLPVLFMLFITLSSFGGGGYQQPVFSLQPQGMYQRELRTNSRGISPDIRFFVGPSFEQTYRPGSEALRRLEKQVEGEYRQWLDQRCGNERAYRNSKLYQARFAGQEARRKAEEIKTPSCDEFTRRFIDKFDR